MPSSTGGTSVSRTVSYASNTATGAPDKRLNTLQTLTGSGAQQPAPDMEENPFALPSDEQIFMLQEDEQRRRREAAAAARTLPVHMKGTFSSQIQATVARDAGGPPRPRGQSNAMDPVRERIAAALAAAPGSRRPEKENMAQFIAKKREIFLVQMSLDTKRAEITKLEERAVQREEALKKSEQMLEEDALRFDAFLKENDEKVQDAIKRAEVEAKAKQDKLLEIKRLNTSIGALRSELSKFEEQLDDCGHYREFLDSITAKEWFTQKQRDREARHQERLRLWQAECDAIKQQKQDAKAAKAKAESDFANARTQQEAERAEQAIRDTAAFLKDAMRIKDPPPPVLEAVEQDSDDMFFREPRQLLAIYAQLEEQNLFLIQNAQESEEALEELRSKFRTTKERLDQESRGLQTQLAHMQALLQAETERCKTLKERAQQNFEVTMGINAHEVSLDQLARRIAEVYERCGFDRDASMSTLQMLTNIEVKLEEYLAMADTMPPEVVEGAEKAREKDRRQVAREEKVQQQKLEHETRVKRALERAAAPVYKRNGKPVMTRSQPLRKKVAVQVQERSNEDTELEQYLARDMLL